MTPATAARKIVTKAIARWKPRWVDVEPTDEGIKLSCPGADSLIIKFKSTCVRISWYIDPDDISDKIRSTHDYSDPNFDVSLMLEIRTWAYKVWERDRLDLHGHPDPRDPLRSRKYGMN